MIRALTLLLIALPGPAWAAPETEDPRFDTCVLCHGTAGRGNLPVSAPRLGGMEPWYIARQLEAFSKGWRGTHPEDVQGREMRPSAEELDSRNRDAAADYFATVRVPPAPDTVTGDVQRGAGLYAPCAGCHAADATGNAVLRAPALAGQSDWYLVTQLENYRRGVRGHHPDDVLGQQMAMQAAALPDATAVRDLVAYINSLD